MIKDYKFNLKKFCFPIIITAFCIVITLVCKARYVNHFEIYNALTTDTIPKPAKDSSRASNRFSQSTDTTKTKDTTVPKRDTFNLKFSKDTLDAPINYEAADSGVLLVKEKKFYLYGKTKTTYKDVTLTAPRVQFNQETNILTAYNAKDSLGDVIARANFQQGSEGFQSDTITFNFKTKRGLTVNTFSKQQDMFVQANLIKKVNDSTTFAKRVIMTTCDYDDPHFGFVAKRAEFINNRVAITGPIHPEFEGVPIPVYLPFGIFPLNQGRHSGFLPPQFTVNQQFGLGLEGLGYYHVINDYYDVTLRGNIYSYGGWSANLTPTYRKRYRYSGGLNLSVQYTKLNFKGDPDYSLTKTYFITWNHSMDSKANPGTSFSANVNAGSSKYNSYLPNDPNRNFQNQLTSSISYTKTWADLPFSLQLSANHNQNNSLHLINVILPDAGFTVNTLYPFQPKNPVGTPKWYEKIGVGYSGVARNQLSFYDTAHNTVRRLLDTLQWGAQNRFPITMSLPPLGPLIVSPFFSYENVVLTHKFGRRWDAANNKVDTTVNQKGLFLDQHVSFGMGFNTAVYGTFRLKKGKIKIHHVIRPNVSINYTPNLSKQYYDVIQVDSLGHKQILPQFEGNMFPAYSYGRYGGITFGVDNNLEMKYRRKKDTVDKKIKLIDGFGFTSGYNFLADSLKLQPFNLYLRTTLFGKVSLTAQGIYDPYEKNTLGSDINRFVWEGTHFTVGRLQSGSISLSTSFQSKPRGQDSKPTIKAPTNGPTADPNMMADRERLQDYARRNPAEFVDFNIPWSINLSYSLNFYQQLQPDYSYKPIVSSSVNFTNSFSLTPKWNFTTNGYYDFHAMKLTMFTMSVSRDMHCWQMSINVTPIGYYPSFNISINPKSSILQDLHINRTRYFTNY